MSVSIRFVLSGACHSAYSGKRVQLKVPLMQESGVPTTTAHMKSMIRKEWPSELSEMQDVINTVEIKVLKEGTLLLDDAPLQSVLTATEMRECVVGEAAATAQDAVEPRSLVMHLVFQTNRATANTEKDGSKRVTDNSSDGGCCRLM